MFDSEYQIERSRATEPLFFRAPAPNGPKSTPREFQHAGVEYALGRNHCLIGDEPGVGKTAQGILISNAINAKRTLVVCPASLRLNWEREIWQWSTKENVQVYVIQSARDGVSEEADFVVVSYDLLRNPAILEGIMACHWDHAILDEAHAIKDPKGNKRTRAICAPDLLPSVTGRFTLLSGTILPNQPIECYNAVRLLDHGAIDNMSLDDFREHYYAMGGGMVRGMVWDDAIGAKVSKVHWSDKVRNIPQNLEELQRRLRSRIMIRRLKDQVHTQLPEKQHKLVPLALTPEMKAAMKHPGWAEVSKLYDLDPENFQADMPVDGAVSSARRLLGEAKIGPVCDYIEELLQEGVNKIVVSAWHTTVLAEARQRLTRLGLDQKDGQKFKVAYMDGSTSSLKRQAAVDEFQNDPSVRLILGQTQVMGEGHTLTAAQDVVLAEPDWVPGRITQMVDRIHRLGQTGSHVIAHLPVAAGTLDERVIATAIQKDRVIYAALDAVS